MSFFSRSSLKGLAECSQLTRAKALTSRSMQTCYGLLSFDANGWNLRLFWKSSPENPQQKPLNSAWKTTTFLLKWPRHVSFRWCICKNHVTGLGCLWLYKKQVRGRIQRLPRSRFNLLARTAERGLMADGFPSWNAFQDVATMDRWISADIVPLGHNLKAHFENMLEARDI